MSDWEIIKKIIYICNFINIFYVILSKFKNSIINLNPGSQPEIQMANKMKKIKIIFPAVIIMLAMVISVTSCKKKETTTTEEDTETNSASDNMFAERISNDIENIAKIKRTVKKVGIVPNQ